MVRYCCEICFVVSESDDSGVFVVFCFVCVFLCFVLSESLSKSLISAWFSVSV